MCYNTLFWRTATHFKNTALQITKVITSRSSPSVGIMIPFCQKRKLSPEVKWSRDMAIAV